MLKIVVGSNHQMFGLSASALLHLIDKESPLIQYAQLRGTAETGDYPHEPGKPHAHVRDGFFVDWDGELFDADRNIRVDLVGVELDELGFFDEMKFRTHPDLIEVVEKFSYGSGTRHCSLDIVNIKDVDVSLDRLEIGFLSVDGKEFVQEIHRSWHVQ